MPGTGKECLWNRKGLKDWDGIFWLKKKIPFLLKTRKMCDIIKKCDF